MVPQIFYEAHNSPKGGHFGITKTFVNNFIELLTNRTLKTSTKSVQFISPEKD